LVHCNALLRCNFTNSIAAGDSNAARHLCVTDFWLNTDMAERLLNSPDAVACKIAFIDIEASGLGAKSWPVEVGWALLGGGDAVGMLVLPDNSWSDDAWDSAAQRLHGLERALLERKGIAVREICSAMNAALADADVYSDAPDWDGFWLFRLFSAGGVKQAFTLRDYGRLVRPLASGQEQDLLRRAVKLAPRRHRAAADALHLRTLYELASCATRLTS
jgi:hypothetical protein